VSKHKGKGGGKRAVKIMTNEDLFNEAIRLLDAARRTIIVLRLLLIEGGKRTCGDPECNRPEHLIRPAVGLRSLDGPQQPILAARDVPQMCIRVPDGIQHVHPPDEPCPLEGRI
jgi:hypothetical protein